MKTVRKVREVGRREMGRQLTVVFAALAVSTLAFTGLASASVSSGRAVIGKVGATDAKAHTSATYKIGSVICDTTNPFWAAEGAGEKAQAKSLGMGFTLLTGNNAGTVSLPQQIADIQTFISEKVSVILVTASDSIGIEGAVARANAAGIPVIAVNSPVGTVKGASSVDTGSAKVVSFVGADNKAYGAAEGALVVKALGGKGNVAMIHGTLGTEMDSQRFSGVLSVFKKHPGIHVIATMDDNWTNTMNITDVQDLLVKYPGTKLSAVMADGPEMYAGANYARSHGNKTIKFFAGDYTTEVKTAIENGALVGTVDQSPGLEGQIGVQYAYDYLTGAKSKISAPTDFIPLPLVTKANVHKMKALWSS